MVTDLNFLATIINGLLYLFLIYISVSFSATAIFLKKGQKTRSQSLFFLTVFIICWNVLYIHYLWNSFFLHTIAAFFVTMILVGANVGSEGTISQRRLTFFTLLAFSSILLVNQADIFQENIVASDTNWVFATTQKWYRLALWAITGIAIIQYWGRQVGNWYCQLSTRRRLRKTLQMAVSQLSQKDYHPAISNYRTALEILNKVNFSTAEKIQFTGTVNLGLGHALWESEKKRSALQHYQQARRYSAIDDLSLNRLAQPTFENQKYNATYSLLTAYPSNLLENRILLGRCCLRLNKIHEAIDVLKKLCIEEPNSWEAHYYLGCAYGWQKTYSKAITSLSTAAHLTPDQQIIFLQRGHAYLKSSNFDKALEDYQQCQQLGGHQHALNFVIGALILERGQVDNAAPLLVTYTRNSKYFEISTLLLGRAYERQKSFEEAIKIYSDALQKDSQRPKLKARLGLVYSKLQNLKKAEGYLTEALHGGLDDDVTLYHLGWVLVHQTKLQDCFHYWNKLTQRYPRKRKLREQLNQIEYHLACTYAKNEDFDKAITTLAEYLKKVKTRLNVSEKHILAEIYFQAASKKIQDHDESVLSQAKKYLNQGHELDSKDFRFLYYLGLAEAMSGNFVGSTRIFQTLVLENPTNRNAAYQLALCRIALGETKSAIQDLERLSNSGEKNAVTQKALLSLSAIRMQNGNWSDAANLLLADHNSK